MRAYLFLSREDVLFEMTGPSGSQPFIMENYGRVVDSFVLLEFKAFWHASSASSTTVASFCSDLSQ